LINHQNESTLKDIAIVNKAIKHQSITSIDGNTTHCDCIIETLSSGEIYQICKPQNWNGELILYAHGYVPVFSPLALPLEDSTFAPLFVSFGYAYATTSYNENGLAIQSGIESMLHLRQRFIDLYGEPKYIYLTGGSEGGLVTALSVERYPQQYNGGLPLCGPCGDFQKQINYYGDFRVLFDYFFPGVLPGDVIHIPDELIANWQTFYIPKVLQAIAANPSKTVKLLHTAHASYVPGDPTSIGTTVIGLLRYDVLATRDAIAKLNGQPYDNSTRIYFGTGSLIEDLKLNKHVQRYKADPSALSTIQKFYQTSGNIGLPVVEAHTTGDPIIPFWQMVFYGAKVIAHGKGFLYSAIPVQRFGHCIFTEAEIVGSFALLVQKVKGLKPVAAQQLIDRSTSTNGKIIQSVRVE
jgi:hypothetical protein